MSNPIISFQAISLYLARRGPCQGQIFCSTCLESMPLWNLLPSACGRPICARAGAPAIALSFQQKESSLREACMWPLSLRENYAHMNSPWVLVKGDQAGCARKSKGWRVHFFYRKRRLEGSFSSPESVISSVEMVSHKYHIGPAKRKTEMLVPFLAPKASHFLHQK